jgi:hypothetical protein
MGIIEDKLAELAAKDRVRPPHVWRAESALVGGSTCTVCGCWGYVYSAPEPGECPGGSEPWRRLRPHTRVRVAVALGEPERRLLGAVLFLERFDRTHGYAVCVDDQGVAYHLHPEALIKEE